MESRSRTPLTPARRTRRLVLAVVVLCCALSLAFIPAATARRDRPTPAPTPGSAPAPSSSAGSSGHAGAPPAPAPAHAHGQSTQSTTAPAGSAPPSRGRHRGDGGSNAPTQGAASTPNPAPNTNTNANPSTGTNPSRGTNRSTGTNRRTSNGTSPRTTSGAGAQPAAGTGAGATPQPGTAGARRRGDGREANARKAASRQERIRAREAARAQASAGEPSAPAPVSTPAVTAAVTPAVTPAVSAAPTQATPSPTPQLALGVSTPAARRAASRGARRAPRKSSHGRAGLGGAAEAFAGVGLAPAAATTAAATPARTPPSAREGAPNSRSSGRTSPIVTTITKIVDVVPTAMRELIGALLALALALAVRSRFAALRARRLERQRSQLLDDVGLLQAALLPVPPARLGPVGTSAAYQPAAGPGAGGDFYDMFPLEDGQLAIIVGDVSGHGRQALPHTALVRFTLRAYLEAGLSPRDAVQTAGAVLERQLGGAFATVLAATYNPRERVLVYASAGHPPPLVLPSQADAGSLPAVTICASPPIGVGMRTGTRQTIVSVPGRSQICFHTDGVTEARVGGELFGAERLASTLVELGPSATAPELLDRVAARTDQRPDDMAACLLRIEGGEDAPTVLVEELELDRHQATSVRTKRFLLACGVERGEVAELTRSAGAAAGRAGTVVLEVRHTDGPPEVALRREHLAYIHARRADVQVAL
jgi:hypothetical protein